ncbi:glycosyltransferase family A protein, partial [Paenibacillus sp. F4]|uniref:glycosyltransferase family 2 protein n=4 Tax=Paenibacillus TaxID=44249 RepID=UPI000CCA6C07
MRNDISVSVIVPVYNVEKYLRKCLESLVNQTMENIEIIVVDDGSTDQSSEIIKEYKEAHPDKIVSLT